MRPETSVRKAAHKAHDRALRSGTDFLGRALFEGPEIATKEAFISGYLNALSDMASADHDPSKATRDELAEQFVIECIVTPPPGQTGSIGNSALTVAFDEWLQDEYPELHGMVSARRCTRALHRALDSRGIGRRAKQDETPGRKGALFGRLSQDFIERVRARKKDDRQPEPALASLAVPVSVWSDDYVLAQRNKSDWGHLPAEDIRHSIRKHMGEQYPEVIAATEQALMRAINQRLDEEVKGARSRNAAGNGRRGIYVLDGETVDQLIERKGRDWVLKHFILEHR